MTEYAQNASLLANSACFCARNRVRSLPSPEAMGVQRLAELIAWQLAVQMKIEVYRLVQNSAAASRDFKYRDQIFDAAAGVEMTLVEGFVRFRALQIIQFFTYARASLEETKRWLLDGVHRGYFTRADIDGAFFLGIRCDIATLRFIKGLIQSVPVERRERLLSRKISSRQLHRVLRVLRARRERREASGSAS